MHKYSESTSKEQGLIVRPKITSSIEKAHKLKQKYKQIAKQVALYKSLPSNLQHGRPRLNAGFCNRVGRKAAKLRKVCMYAKRIPITCDNCMYVCLAADKT